MKSNFNGYGNEWDKLNKLQSIGLVCKYKYQCLEHLFNDLEDQTTRCSFQIDLASFVVIRMLRKVLMRIFIIETRSKHKYKFS